MNDTLEFVYTLFDLFAPTQKHLIETMGFSAPKTRLDETKKVFHMNKIFVHSIAAAAAGFDYLQFIHAHQIKWCNIREFMDINYALHTLVLFCFFLQRTRGGAEHFVLCPIFFQSFCNVGNFSRNAHACKTINYLLKI